MCAISCIPKHSPNLASLVSPRKTGWRMSASLASRNKPGWQMSASLASPAHFRKRPFWRVLKFAKNGKFLASTRIQQIRRRVAIAYFRVKKNIGYDSMKCNNPYSLNEKQNTIILISFEIRFCTLIWRKKNRLAIFWEVALKVITQFHQKIRRKKNSKRKTKNENKS